MALVILAFLLFILCIGLTSYIKLVYDQNRKVKVKRVNEKYDSSDSTTIEIYSQAPGPAPWPVIGNLDELGKYDVPFEAFTALAKKYGDVYSLSLGSTRCLVVNNLDLIREVLNQNGRFFGGRPDFIRYRKLFGGDRNNSLALCDWSSLQQKRRNLARKHCSPRTASTFHQKMSDVGCMEMNEMLCHLKKVVTSGVDFNLKPLLMQTCANMFTTYMCTRRFDYDDKEFTDMVRSYDEVFWEINQGYAVDFLPWLIPFYVKHMSKLSNWSLDIRKFILARIINDREQNLEDDEKEKDFTDALLKSLKEDSNVSRDTIIFMLEDFLGGHSAIGNLVMLALGYIAKDSQVAAKIQQEVDLVSENGTRLITLDDLDKLSYTVATVFEVLRYSSSPIVPHVATEDVTVAGYGVTKGTVVFINNYELNTSERYWENPKSFDPSRFLEPITEVADAHSQQPTMRVKKNIPHFLPFSIGKRTCIGQNLVRNFSFIMLANILMHYNVSSQNPSSIKVQPACVAVPPDTYKLALTPRKANAEI